MTPRETINLAIANSENYIAKCKGTEVQPKYLAVFQDTMMAVGIDEDGDIFFVETPYTLTQAQRLSRLVSNGHGQRPVVMTHAEYLQKSIEQQEAHLETLRRIQTQVN